MNQCPTCLGEGEVLANFYKRPWEERVSETLKVSCQTCEGEGELDISELAPPPPPEPEPEEDSEEEQPE